MSLKRPAKDQPENFEFSSSSLEEAKTIIAKYPDSSNRIIVKNSFPKINLNIDALKINIAIKNIIDNAISFSPKPGIIKVLLSSTSNYLSIAIVDEGPGIKEPDMKRIFERFYSLREEDNKSHSGLGLNIAKQIVDAHEGSISVDNVIEENVIKGAKFIVNLPQVNINK